MVQRIAEEKAVRKTGGDVLALTVDAHRASETGRTVGKISVVIP